MTDREESTDHALINQNPSPTATIRPSDKWLTPPNVENVDIARLLAWIKKRGMVWPLEKVKKKWIQMGHSNSIETVLTNFGLEKVIVARIGDEMFVRIRDRAWADNWAVYYGVETTHHGQFEHPSKRIRSEL